MEAAASPLPRDDTTPPVTKMNLVATSLLPSCRRWLRHPGRPPRAHEPDLIVPAPRAAVDPRVPEPPQHEPDGRPARHAQVHELLSAKLRPDPRRAREAPVELRARLGSSDEPRPCEIGRRPVPQQRRPRRVGRAPRPAPYQRAPARSRPRSAAPTAPRTARAAAPAPAPAGSRGPG